MSRRAGPVEGADALACPWSGTALPAVRSLRVAALPSLAPTLPTPRSSATQLRPAPV